MRLRTKLLLAAVVVAALVVTPAVSFYAIHSVDAPPPEDADLRVADPQVPPGENAFPLIRRAAKAVFWLKEDQWLDGKPPEGADAGGLAGEEAQRWWEAEYPGEAESGRKPDPLHLPDPSFPLGF